MKLLSSPYMLAVISIVYMIGSSIQQSYFPSADPPPVVITEVSSADLDSVTQDCPAPEKLATPAVRQQSRATVSLVNLEIPVPEAVTPPSLVLNYLTESSDSNFVTAELDMDDERFSQDEDFLIEMK